MKKVVVAVVGALGAVGTQMLAVLEKSSLPLAEVVPMDTEDNYGKQVEFKGRGIPVQKAVKGAFAGIDIALFSAGEAASKALAPTAIAEGAVVIDNSNAFRMEDWVPLVVPEVNPEAAMQHQGLIANPNCSTIQMVVALKPLHDLFRIKRIVVATYQAVSGTGLAAMEELEEQVGAYVLGRPMPRKVYPHQIAFNVLPHIDSFMDNGYTKEEMKIHNETRKILADDSVQVTATAVRVPVFRCHSEAVNIETEKELPDVAQIREILRKAPGVTVVDDPEKNQYPLPLYCQDTYQTYVGRIRKDYTIPNGLSMWVVADNLLKGAARNAVQIAELLVERQWLARA